MSEITKKTGSEVERNPDGTIKSGALNPHGRPKGKTMKEFAREFYFNKTDEEKREYIEWLDKQKPGFAWTMGEGNPQNSTELSGELNLVTEEKKKELENAIKDILPID